MRTISKDAMIHSPILVFQDFENPFTLYKRDSGYASGFNLTHVQSNKKISILYGGPNFTDLEKKKKNSQQQKDRHPVFLLLQKNEYLTGQSARLALKIQRYEFKLLYHPRKKHGNSDTLPWRIYATTTDIPIFPGKTEIKQDQLRDPQMKQLLLYLDENKLTSNKADVTRAANLESSFVVTEGIVIIANLT